MAGDHPPLEDIGEASEAEMIDDGPPQECWIKTIERKDGSTIDLTIAIDKRRRIDTAYEVYLGLYQAITGPEERQKLYQEFSRS